jgi:plastocyanin
MRRLVLLLTPLLLVALPVLGCGGGGSADVPALATAAVDATPASSFNVVAKNLKYDTDTLVVNAGQEVVINFENQDSALHNISVYSLDGDDSIFRGDLFKGPDESKEYRFQAPPAGVYYFHCDAHPEMSGVFISR